MNLFAGLEKFGLKAESVDLYGEAKAAEEKAKAEAEAAEIPKEEDFLLEKSIECPVCGKKFKTLNIKTGKVRRLEPDTDLRPRQEYIDALKYDVASCPNCGYTALNRYFEHITNGQIKLIKEQICSNFKPNRTSDSAIPDYDAAVETHKLSLYNTISKRGRTSEIAYTCLIISWLLRAKAEEIDTSTEIGQQKFKDCKAEEETFYRQAYDGFLKAVSTELYPICGMDQSTMDYLLSNMAFYFKKYDVASKCLSRVLTSSTANRKIKDKSLELKEEIVEQIKRDKQM